MEAEKHKYCKLCGKSFLNGRALGGHMRSHLLHHPLPDSASSSMPDPCSSFHDTESETDSSKKPNRSRSTLNRRSIYVALRHYQSNEEDKSETEFEMIKIRARKSHELSESCTEQEPMSSVSDAATAEEDVALSLVMLSRDKWEKEKQESTDERCKKMKKWFECETCEKVFKSYQALGGHRASHKKKRPLSDQSDHKGVKESEKKSSHHECPICFKVFSSGQALGGHKRSHASANESTKRKIISLIDLNLPAQPEEEDLVSSVFNAQVGDQIGQ